MNEYGTKILVHFTIKKNRTSSKKRNQFGILQQNKLQVCRSLQNETSGKRGKLVLCTQHFLLQNESNEGYYIKLSQHDTLSHKEELCFIMQIKVQKKYMTQSWMHKIKNRRSPQKKEQRNRRIRPCCTIVEWNMHFGVLESHGSQNREMSQLL